MVIDLAPYARQASRRALRGRRRDAPEVNRRWRIQQSMCRGTSVSNGCIRSPVEPPGNLLRCRSMAGTASVRAAGILGGASAMRAAAVPYVHVKPGCVACSPSMQVSDGREKYRAVHAGGDVGLQLSALGEPIRRLVRPRRQYRRCAAGNQRAALPLSGKPIAELDYVGRRCGDGGPQGGDRRAFQQHGHSWIHQQPQELLANSATGAEHDK